LWSAEAFASPAKKAGRSRLRRARGGTQFLHIFFLLYLSTSCPPFLPSGGAEGEPYPKGRNPPQMLYTYGEVFILLKEACWFNRIIIRQIPAASLTHRQKRFVDLKKIGHFLLAKQQFEEGVNAVYLST